MSRVKNVDKVENTDERIKWKNRENGFTATVEVKDNGDAYMGLNGKKVRVNSRSKGYYIASDFMKETAEIGA